MSSGPVTLGIMITSSLSPTSVTAVMMSSRPQGESIAFTLVHSCALPGVKNLATSTRPDRAASLSEAGTPSSRFASSTSTCWDMSGTLPTIFWFDAGKKWIIRDGRTGISRTGAGAPTARGRKKSFAVTMGFEDRQTGTVSTMYEWSDEQLMVRDAVRQFIDKEIRPNLDELEHGDTPPYDVLRKLFATFGMDAMARDGFKRRIEREKAQAAGESAAAADDGGGGGGGAAGMTVIPIIELCRYCPGMVTAMGVSMGLTASAIMSRGTTRQKEQWAVDLLTMDKIGAWAITEPDSGSDAFGSMKSTARRDGDEYVLTGS